MRAGSRLIGVGILFFWKAAIDSLIIDERQVVRKIIAEVLVARPYFASVLLRQIASGHTMGILEYCLEK